MVFAASNEQRLHHHRCSATVTVSSCGISSNFWKCWDCITYTASVRRPLSVVYILLSIVWFNIIVSVTIVVLNMGPADWSEINFCGKLDHFSEIRYSYCGV